MLVLILRRLQQPDNNTESSGPQATVSYGSPVLPVREKDEMKTWF